MPSYFAERQVTLIRSGPREPKPIEDVVLESTDDFLACAAARVVEIRARNVRLDLKNRPDWLTLEFFPSELRTQGSAAMFADVLEAAESTLAQLNLAAVWKVGAGGKATVMLPVKRDYEFAVIFDFSKMLAELIHEQVPTCSTIKKHESGSRRVWIDYHSNHHAHTIVAPFSPISTPTPLALLHGVELPVSFKSLIHSLRSEDRPLRFDLSISEVALNTASRLLRRAAESPNDLESAFIFIEGRYAAAL